MSSPDQSLATSCASVAQVARDFMDWIERNAENIGRERAGLEKEFRRFNAEAKRLERAVERPMCVGVFGPSQAGKSYLISALAKKGTRPLLAQFGDQAIDFIREINPPGGKESTGLVTRFSLRSSDGHKPGPVEMRLLSQTDIVKIIGNTFYGDCDDSEMEPLTPAYVAEVIASVKNAVASTPVDPLTAEDVYDLQAYFEKTQKGKERVKTLRHSFWAQAAELAPRLRKGERARLFSLIWGGNEKFTNLYLRLYSDIAQLDFSATAYADMDALMPRAKSIIDVENLKGLGTDQQETLRLVNEVGTSIRLPRCEAAALVAELRIQIAEKPWDFFDHTDLLDFPGARSREQIKDLDVYFAQPDALHLLYLRGKVAYLFERYCAEQELTSMLLCIGPSNQEVKSLPEMVFSWISSTHGATPEQRARQRTALFVVLTKFDMEFEEKTGEDSNPFGRWSTRIGSSLVGYLGSQFDWPLNWDGSGPFKNTFWLRNPEIKARAFFDFGPDDLESGIRVDSRARLDAFRQGFLGNVEANRFFANPERAWAEAFSLNDGGVAFLAESLAPLCDPNLKKEQIRGHLSRLCQQMLERMPVPVGANVEEEISRRRTASRVLAAQLVKGASAQRFGHLIQTMQLSSEDVEHVFYKVNAAAPEESDEASGANDTGDAVDDEMIKLLGLDDIIPPQEAKAPVRIKDEADRFAECIMCEWMRDLHDIAGNEVLSSYFKLSDGYMAELVQELICGAKRLNIEGMIGKAVRRTGAYHQKFQMLVAPTVRITANILNNYINHLGYDQVPLDKRPQLSDGNGQFRPVFSPRPIPDSIPNLADSVSRHDQQFYTDWIKALLELVEANATGGDDRKIDLQSNAQLEGFRSLLVPAAA